MPKTVTPESQKSGIWSGIEGRLQQFILHIRFWRWAAVHSPHFKHFEFGYTKIIQFRANFYPYSSEFCLIEISLNKPMLYLFEPSSAIHEYCYLTGVEPSMIDGIPF